MLKAKRTSSWFAVLLCLVILTGFGVLPVMAATQPTDISNHWAMRPIENMINEGVVSGYPDGTFQPDQPVTRAEFITMINRAFQFTAAAPIAFYDVGASNWFAPEIAKAQAAGYISGYPDGGVHPNQQITRQEVAIMLATATGLNMNQSGRIDVLNKFTDFSSIPSWSALYIDTVVKAGFMNGFPDGTFQAWGLTSRAMAAAILNQAISKNDTIYNSPGTYGPPGSAVTVNGNVVITSKGITLQNMIISRNLIISPSVGLGNVVLKNVTIKGNTIISAY